MIKYMTLILSLTLGSHLLSADETWQPLSNHLDSTFTLKHLLITENDILGAELGDGAFYYVFGHENLGLCFSVLRNTSTLYQFETKAEDQDHIATYKGCMDNFGAVEFTVTRYSANDLKKLQAEIRQRRGRLLRETR